MDGFSTKRNSGGNMRLQDDIGEAVHAFAEIAGEAKRERLVHLTADPDTAALARTLLRLRHDLVMIGRAASAPLPDPLTATLVPRLAQIGAAARDYLLASATALTARQVGPSTEPVGRVVAAYMCEISSSRTATLMQGLPVEERERIFASGFALQQLQQNLSDLAGCLHEWRAPGKQGASACRFISPRSPHLWATTYGAWVSWCGRALTALSGAVTVR